MRCQTARRWMTMGLTADLSAGRAGRLEDHVARCAECARERGAYAALGRALGGLPMSASLPAALEQDTLRRVRLGAPVGPRPRGAPWWVGVGVPALAGTAVVMLALREAPVRPGPSSSPVVIARPLPDAPGTRVASAGPAVRKRRGAPEVPRQPPPELAARPDLFVNLPLLRNLDKLEHYEAIQTTTPDGSPGRRSNG